MIRAGLVALAASTIACAPGGAQVRPASAPTADEDARAHAAQLATAEEDVIDTLAAADPRLARRFDAHASPEMVEKLATAAILAEDATATMQGGSLDLFAFKARAAAFAQAAIRLGKVAGALPDVAPPGESITRPRLERELMARAIEEEKARVTEEAPLGDASASLVRAMVELWAPGATAAAWHEMDDLTSRRLLQIRDSLENAAPRTSASDLEPALFELEKLLVPMQFGKSAFALTQLHAALDKDQRVTPARMVLERLTKLAQVHLGISVTVATGADLEVARVAVAQRLDAALDGATGEARDAIAKDARTMLFADSKCSAVTGSRVRSAAPPPERAAICGVLLLVDRAEAGERRQAALMALHDEIVVAEWTLVPPSPRAHLATRSVRVDDDLADTLKQMAAARPLVPLAAGLAASFVYRTPAEATRLARAWQSFGDAPLDVAERELSAVTPPPASLRP